MLGTPYLRKSVSCCAVHLRASDLGTPLVSASTAHESLEVTGLEGAGSFQTQASAELYSVRQQLRTMGSGGWINK